mgnify:CR=1 FL=1
MTFNNPCTYLFANTMIFANVILSYVIRELWKDNKKQKDIIRLQENLIKKYKENDKKI